MRAKRSNPGDKKELDCFVANAPRDDVAESDEGRADYTALAAGTGSAVTDLIFSIANREVTFFSATELISFL